MRAGLCQSENSFYSSRSMLAFVRRIDGTLCFVFVCLSVDSSLVVCSLLFLVPGRLGHLSGLAAHARGRGALEDLREGMEVFFITLINSVS